MPADATVEYSNQYKNFFKLHLFLKKSFSPFCIHSIYVPNSIYTIERRRKPFRGGRNGLQKKVTKNMVFTGEQRVGSIV